MKNIVVPFVFGLILVPVFFNSCQGGFHSQKSLGSNIQTASCKVTVENGHFKKLSHDYNAPSSVFQYGKVQLGQQQSEGAFSKATDTDFLSQGTALSAIFDNACLKDGVKDGAKENVAGDKGHLLSDLLTEDQEPIQELVHQAYTITLEKNYSVAEINEMSDPDPCLIGVSWNEKYVTQATFNDAEMYQQGHHTALKTSQAYDTFFGSAGPRASAGSTVRIAVVDSGVDWQHPDLQSNFWVHSQGWGIDATTIQGGTVNYNPFDISPVGHGTHIAGIIGAVANNSIGVAGTMPYNARIMAIKIFKLGAGNEIETSTTHFFNGLQFAILNGAEVINLSLMATGTTYDAVADSAITTALQKGITVIGAMGNGSPNGSLVDKVSLSVVPAIFSTRPGVLAVGSIDADTQTKSSFSHYGTMYAEISAPGADSTSSGIFSTLPIAKGSYGRLKGTSQSTAFVSGAAGLVISAIKSAYGVAPSPTEVERLILSSAYKNPALTSYFKDGNQLDLNALVVKMHQDYPKTISLTGSVIPETCP